MTFNNKQTFKKIEQAIADALAYMITDYCGCLMKRDVIIPDIDAHYEIDEIINFNVVKLVNEYLTIQQAVDYIDQGKSHAQSTFKPYAMDRKIDSDLISFTPQLCAQQALQLTRDQGQELSKIFFIYIYIYTGLRQVFAKTNLDFFTWELNSIFLFLIYCYKRYRKQESLEKICNTCLFFLKCVRYDIIR